jgi:hypothetical protein
LTLFFFCGLWEIRELVTWKKEMFQARFSQIARGSTDGPAGPSRQHRFVGPYPGAANAGRVCLSRACFQSETHPKRSSLHNSRPRGQETEREEVVPAWQGRDAWCAVRSVSTSRQIHTHAARRLLKNCAPIRYGRLTSLLRKG